MSKISEREIGVSQVYEDPNRDNNESKDDDNQRRKILDFFQQHNRPLSMFDIEALLVGLEKSNVSCILEELVKEKKLCSCEFSVDERKFALFWDPTLLPIKHSLDKRMKIDQLNESVSLCLSPSSASSSSLSTPSNSPSSIQPSPTFSNGLHSSNYKKRFRTNACSSPFKTPWKNSNSKENRTLEDNARPSTVLISKSSNKSTKENSCSSACSPSSRQETLPLLRDPSFLSLKKKRLEYSTSPHRFKELSKAELLREKEIIHDRLIRKEKELKNTKERLQAMEKSFEKGQNGNDNLNFLIEKWTAASQRILLELQQKSAFPVSLALLMAHFRIDEEMQKKLGYVPDTDSFTIS